MNTIPILKVSFIANEGKEFCAIAVLNSECIFAIAEILKTPSIEKEGSSGAEAPLETEAKYVLLET